MSAANQVNTEHFCACGRKAVWRCEKCGAWLCDFDVKSFGTAMWCQECILELDR